MNAKKLMALAVICVAAASPSLAGLVARWDFNNYDPSNPTSAAILAPTVGTLSAIPCTGTTASTEVTDGTLGSITVVNTGLPEGDYQFVVWSGISNSQYAVSGDNSTMDAFRLSLAGSSTTVTNRLPDVYYGILSTVHYDDAYAVHDVWMMKDTNQLTCLFVPLSGDVAVNPADYDVKVVSANGTMNVMNKPVSATPITYLPFERNSVTVNDSEYGELHGIGFSLTTLRLMADLDSRLVFQKADTGETIFNISLPEYIGMIGSYYTNLGRSLTLQEYLDRQDFYHIVFFLSEDFSTLIRLDVNSWRLRAKNHLKL